MGVSRVITRVAALCGALAALYCAHAQEAAEAASQRIAVGSGEIVNTGPWTPETRKEHRTEEIWHHYMHGIVDHFATPVALEDLFGEGQDRDGWLVTDQPVETPFKRSSQPALRLVRSDRIDLERPLPLDMDAVRGRRIRIFVWHKGDDIGARNNCWHSADIYTTIRDAEGRALAGAEGYFQTLRTFPWHCYHVERFIPRNAAGVYLSFYNKFHGVAHFSTLSWEPVDGASTYTTDEKQDPWSGSLAFNPKYQEMPYHLKWGTLEARSHPWRFVLGERIGLVGQPYDITTREGFRRYYFEKAKREPEHMNHGILYMLMMYHAGSATGLLPPLEEGWLGNYAQIILEDQDPETGFWHDGVNLSLGLTFHICDTHFRYHCIPRTDHPPRIFPTMDLGLKRMPRAESIIRTVLMMQSSYVDEEGVRRKAAWNWPAYRYTTEPDAHEERCRFATTWDAINLMRRASNYVDEQLRDEVYEAVKAAFRYVLRHNVLDDGLFLQSDLHEHPTLGDYMWGIIQDSSYLERRIMDDLPRPQVAATLEDGRLVLSWSGPAPEHNSLRVYALPADVPEEQLTEAHLAGIIHRSGGRPYEMDPITATRRILGAMSERWGVARELPGPDTWQGRRYLPWKLRQVPSPLPFTDQLEPLVLSADQVADGRLLVSAVTWYGEESRPVEVGHPAG